MKSLLRNAMFHPPNEAHIAQSSRRGKVGAIFYSRAEPKPLDRGRWQLQVTWLYRRGPSAAASRKNRPTGSPWTSQGWACHLMSSCKTINPTLNPLAGPADNVPFRKLRYAETGNWVATQRAITPWVVRTMRSCFRASRRRTRAPEIPCTHQ